MRLFVLLAFLLSLAACDRGTTPPAAPPANASASGTAAGLRQVVLSVPGMTCAACPITVRKALEGVDGVSRAMVDFDSKTAVVLFDPARTSIDALLAATAAAGYPATVAETEPGKGGSPS